MSDIDTFSLLIMLLMIFAGFSVIRITSKLNKSIDESLNKRTGLSSFSQRYLKREKNLERLVREQEPFNWRIGLALSISELDNQQEKQFLEALRKVLRYENSIVHHKDDLKRRLLRQLLHPIYPSKDFKEILRFRDLFTVKRLMDGSTDKETLKYILQLSIDEYETKKTPPTSYTETIRYMDSDDDPFSPEPPF